MQCFTEFMPIHIRASYDRYRRFLPKKIDDLLTSCHLSSDVLHKKSIL